MTETVIRTIRQRRNLRRTDPKPRIGVSTSNGRHRNGIAFRRYGGPSEPGWPGLRTPLPRRDAALQDVAGPLAHLPFRSGIRRRLVPAFVVSEVEAFLRCGILAHGFVLAKCRECGWSRAVAFSCQRRGPSCIGRRMCDFAAALADRVIPRAPVRQWVLTVPHGLRGRMAYDPALTTEVLRQLISAVSAWLRARARRLGIRGVG